MSFCVCLRAVLYFWVMVLKEKYTTLQRTIDGMQRQIQDSLSFARNFVPRGETPRSLFALLKQHTTYRNDPPGVELLQSMPTLIANNFYGISGAGDCDCLTIAAVACCVVENIPVRIVVVGNTKTPTHVYCEVLDNGRYVAFDLVNEFYGQTKKYKYLSRIKVR